MTTTIHYTIRSGGIDDLRAVWDNIHRFENTVVFTFLDETYYLSTGGHECDESQFDAPVLDTGVGIESPPLFYSGDCFQAYGTFDRTPLISSNITYEFASELATQFPDDAVGSVGENSIRDPDGKTGSIGFIRELPDTDRMEFGWMGCFSDDVTETNNSSDCVPTGQGYIDVDQPKPRLNIALKNLDVRGIELEPMGNDRWSEIDEVISND